MTSNSRRRPAQDQTTLGFRKADSNASYDGMKKTILGEIEKHFRPEFPQPPRRHDHVRSLTREDLKTVVEYELARGAQAPDRPHIPLEVSQEAKEFLIDAGYNPDFERPAAASRDRAPRRDSLSESLLRAKSPKDRT